MHEMRGIFENFCKNAIGGNLNWWYVCAIECKEPIAYSYLYLPNHYATNAIAMYVCISEWPLGLSPAFEHAL